MAGILIDFHPKNRMVQVLDGGAQAAEREDRSDDALQPVSRGGLDRVGLPFVEFMPGRDRCQAARSSQPGPGLLDRNREGLTDPADQPRLARVLLQILAEASQFGLPAAADALKLLVPISARAETRVDQTQDSLATLAFQKIIDGNLSGLG